MNIQLTSTKIINWICVLLILVMVVLLFTPYWTYTAKEKNPDTGKREDVVKEISINDYVWFPGNHKNMTKEFQKLYEEKSDFWINDLVLAPVLVLLLGTVVGVISLWYANIPLSAILALVLGGLSTHSYLTRPEFGLGNPTVHIIISAITGVVGLVGVVWFIVKQILKRKKA